MDHLERVVLPTPRRDSWAGVKVWKVLPELVDDPLERLIDVLDSAERGQARSNPDLPLRRDYAIAHACLREILAGELGIAPREVSFALAGAPSAKPSLADGTHGLSFNLSHTPGLILIAVAREREVGVDVEWLGRRVRAAALSGRRLSESERSVLARASRAERVRCFLQLWTRREAHAKMTGEGLPRAIAEDAPPCGPHAKAGSWLCDLDLGPDYVGALALGPRVRVDDLERGWPWSSREPARAEPLDSRE